MADKSAIEWTDASWTPIRARNLKTGKVGWHCEHATTGCVGCYAEGMNKRLGTGLPFKPGHRKDIEIFLDEEMLLAPLRWKKPRMIFVCSMTDAFASFVKDEWLDKMFAVMALTPQHTYQVLTKRADRMRAYFEGDREEAVFQAKFKVRPASGHSMFDWPLRNVWLGVSTERQQEADERIPLLLTTPAAVSFISAEPLLGPINLFDFIGPFAPAGFNRAPPALNWVIVGGESGPGARPMHPDWARSLRDQCAAADVPFFFKQWGEWAPYKPVAGGDLGGEVRHGIARVVHPTGQTDLEVFEATGGRNTIPGTRYVKRIGKKAAGRLLDSTLHNEFPQAKEVAFG